MNQFANAQGLQPLREKAYKVMMLEIEHFIKRLAQGQIGPTAHVTGEHLVRTLVDVVGDYGHKRGNAAGYLQTLLFNLLDLEKWLPETSWFPRILLNNSADAKQAIQQRPHSQRSLRQQHFAT